MKVISDDQRELNRKLHQDEKYGNRHDGAGVATKLPEAITTLNKLGVCKSLLDYGTGKGKLVNRLRQHLSNTVRIDGYDPSVEQWSELPGKTYDIVTCLDVLEHVELDTINNVIDDIKQLSKKFCYVVVDLQPAVKTMEDGRNAHILLAPQDWWINKFAERFECHIAFPLYHNCGLAQKLVIVASDKPSMMPMMFGFLIKIDIFNLNMAGGILQTLANKREKK